MYPNNTITKNFVIYDNFRKFIENYHRLNFRKLKLKKLNGIK